MPLFRVMYQWMRDENQPHVYRRTTPHFTYLPPSLHLSPLRQPATVGWARTKNASYRPLNPKNTKAIIDAF